MDIEFDISEVEDAWEASQQRLRGDVAAAVRTAAELGIREAVNRHHYKNRTAQLTASLNAGFPVTTSDGYEMSMFAGESYASYVDDWEQQKFGGHYGSSDSFMGFAAAKAEQVLTDELERAVARLEQNFNGR